MLKKLRSLIYAFSTRAMVYVANIGEAERAVLECNQMLYKGRRLLVNISKYLGDNTVNFLSSYHEMDNIKCTVTATGTTNLGTDSFDIKVYVVFSIRLKSFIKHNYLLINFILC